MSDPVFLIFLVPLLLFGIFMWALFACLYPLNWIWRSRGSGAHMAKIVIELFESDDWPANVRDHHPTGVRVDSDGWLFLPGGDRARIGAYWEHLIKRSRSDFIKRREAEKLEAATVRFGENVINFAKSKAGR